MPLPTRHHQLVGHTADLGLVARAPSLPALFEEAAAALAEAAADVQPAPVGAAEPLELAADDLAALVYAWLNELIGLAGARGEALAGTSVDAVEGIAGGWRLRGAARFVPFADGRSPGARARVDVKSATYHRLAVRRSGGEWRLTAFLDV